MTEILKLNSISNKIFDVLDDKYTVTDKSVNPEAIILRSFKMHDYNVPDSVLAIGRAGAGVNNIPIPKMTEKGIVVFNTPGANANAVKELTICALFLASRNIVGGINWSKELNGKGDEVPSLVESGKSKFGGCEIFGKTLCVLGLGAIGIKVANACKCLGMKVYGYDPYITDANKELINKDVVIVDFDTAIAKGDYLTLHLPYMESTKEIINKSVLEKMKKGASVINMSRAELVNTSDIKEAIKNNLIKNYVVDFPTESVLDTEGIITIPHLGASTEEAEENCAIMAAEQLKDYLENGNIKNSVNFPQIYKNKEGKFRLTISYKVGQGVEKAVQKALSEIKYTSLQKEKKDIGFIIIDSENEFNGQSNSKSIIESLSEINGILSIRLL